MKYKILIPIVLSWVTCALSAQVITEKKVIWDYPIKPGMEEWQQFKSEEEMFQACQIPDTILKRSDTESLVEICYNFPAFMALFFYNSPQAGFDVFYSRFNGIRELLDRKDAGCFVLKKYSSMSSSDFKSLWTSAEKGLYAFKYEYFEIILAQPQIIQSLNTEDRKFLMKETIKKFDEKIAASDVFGGNSLSVNAWIMVNNLNQEKKLTSKFLIQSEVDKSLKSGLLFDYDLNSIYQQAVRYVNE